MTFDELINHRMMLSAVVFNHIYSYKSAGIVNYKKCSGLPVHYLKWYCEKSIVTCLPSIKERLNIFINYKVKCESDPRFISWHCVEKLMDDIIVMKQMIANEKCCDREYRHWSEYNSDNDEEKSLPEENKQNIIRNLFTSVFFT